ncbi:unnamed protein product, partial [Mesorhabditis spiculigera]
MSVEDEDDLLSIQIFVPEIQVRKCLTVSLEDFVWDVKRKLLATLPQALPQAFNYGLFLPPCDGRAGKFLLEDRPVRDYPFHDCVPYLELKFKKRVYKMLNLDEKQLKGLHTKANLKKFMDYVQNRNAEKVEKMCTQGLDSNFHDAAGETPLTLAAGVPDNRKVLLALVGGGAHIDFRNSEGQTAMHKAAFLSSVENVKTLLELGASPNYRDPIGLTPLYYNMLTTDSNDLVAQMLLSEAADMGVTDMHGNHEIHQACKNGLVKHVEHLLYYGGDVDAENVNGNTPLHVCAVNNRPECAKVLLFRCANHLTANKQGQTALHVAHIVGSAAVADVIQGHDPHTAVPYRGTPQYSTRRRVSVSTLSRRRSLSQSSLASHDVYRASPSIRGHGSRAPSMAPSPTPSRATIVPSEYGTLRRFAPDHVSSGGGGHECNVPRILVIPRGPKGFGFILRGAKHVDAEMDFHPSALQPALQFFEGVDMSGMAMKAGLRPGDFLLQIDGVDVRCASHDQVVHLIQQAGDTITLKVITVDPSQPFPGTGTIVARRHHSGDIREEYYAPRTASVRNRPMGSRRISAAELENLMVRQNGHPIPQQYQSYDQESLCGDRQPKKFTSVADLKRRKNQRSVDSPQPGRAEFMMMNQEPIYGSPAMKSFSSAPDMAQYDDGTMTGSRYSSPYAPPAQIYQAPQHSHYGHIVQNNNTIYASQGIYAKNGHHPPGASVIHVPGHQQQKYVSLRKIDVDTYTYAQAFKLQTRQNGADATRRDEQRPTKAAGAGAGGKPDFQMDLRNALAKRRSKVQEEDEEDDKRTDSDGSARFGGLSLRESVRETVTAKKTPQQHSPPGIGHKKDSGYTSSRTSLEPSEADAGHYGHSEGQAYHHDSPGSNHKVQIISQSIEDNYGSRRAADTMSVTSSLSTSSAPALPPVDYDDSGHGDSDNSDDPKELSEYVAMWSRAGVDGRALHRMDRSQFTQLGVTRIAHRQRIEASIRHFLKPSE